MKISKFTVLEHEIVRVNIFNHFIEFDEKFAFDWLVNFDFFHSEIFCNTLFLFGHSNFFINSFQRLNQKRFYVWCSTFERFDIKYHSASSTSNFLKNIVILHWWIQILSVVIWVIIEDCSIDAIRLCFQLSFKFIKFWLNQSTNFADIDIIKS